VQTIFSIILSSVDVSGFMVLDNFKLKNGSQSREFKLGLLSQSQSGILVRLDKRFVKEPMLDLMEDLRFFARARPNVDIVWGIATSLYEWQLVRYSKQLEIR